MNQASIDKAADILWHKRLAQARLSALPAECKPATLDEGYAVQAAMVELAEQNIFGWKIAATSAAGQAHIGVDGPLAGRLLADRVLPDGGQVPFASNGMRVAEAEFAFVMGADLPARTRVYEIGEVVGAAERVHPAIEIPNSRYRDFVTAGAPQLIADNACACWFVLGARVLAPWRDHDFGSHAVRGWRNGRAVAEGTGANVLGDPRIALTWLANELRAHGIGLAAGQIVTTGTCVVPFAIDAGDRIAADFGPFGRVEALIGAA